MQILEYTPDGTLVSAHLLPEDAARYAAYIEKD